MIQPCLYTNDMQGGVENYLAQNDSNNEYKLMLGYTLTQQEIFRHAHLINFLQIYSSWKI